MPELPVRAARIFRTQGTVNRTAFWLFKLAVVLLLVAAIAPVLRG